MSEQSALTLLRGLAFKMSNGALAAITIFLFVVFVTMKGNLERYLRLLFG